MEELNFLKIIDPPKRYVMYPLFYYPKIKEIKYVLQVYFKGKKNNIGLDLIMLSLVCFLYNSTSLYGLDNIQPVDLYCIVLYCIVRPKDSKKISQMHVGLVYDILEQTLSLGWSQ